MKSETKKLWKKITTIALLTAGNMIFFLTIWLANKYDHVSLDQFIYQMKAPATGAESSLTNSAIIRVGLFGALLTGFEIFIYLLCSGFFKEQFKESAKYIKFCGWRICKFIT